MKNYWLKRKDDKKRDNYRRIIFTQHELCNLAQDSFEFILNLDYPSDIQIQQDGSMKVINNA